ncbi:MAG: alpha/beta fold hydrolase, partial [Myxococcota bacterium]
MKITYQRDSATGVGLRTFAGQAADARKLVCLPFAGGTSPSFRPLAEALGPTWLMTAVDLPGHVFGAVEPPLDSIEALCDVLEDQLTPEIYADGYLLGYSVGGYIAYGLMERWEARDAPRPRGLILCAANPHTRRQGHRFSQYTDDEMFDLLERLGGMYPQVRENRELFDLAQPALRAGFAAYETAPLPTRTLETPTLLVGGRSDVLAKPENLDAWRQFCPRLTIEMVDGRHIFLDDRRVELAKILTHFADRVDR